MKLGEVGRSLVGGLVVYVAMAACSASGKMQGSSGTGHAGGANGAGGHGGLAQTGGGGHGGMVTGSGGQSGTGNGGDDGGGIWDALTDPIPGAAAEPTSGSRLKAKYRVADDGSKAYLPAVWYDSQRQEDCYFNLAADGKERCLPTPGAANVGQYFADAACTSTVAQGYANCALKYAVAYDTSSCLLTTGPIHIYTVGAPMVATNLYVKSGNSCVAAGQQPPVYAFYQLGPEIPPSSYVASTLQVDP